MKVDVIKDKEIIKRELIAYVESKTAIGIYYKVVITNNNMSCTCPQYRHRKKYCKHIEAVQFRR